MISKSRLFIISEETTLRDLPLQALSAITISETSPEFILHVQDDADERLTANNQRQQIL